MASSILPTTRFQTYLANVFSTGNALIGTCRPAVPQRRRRKAAVVEALERRVLLTGDFVWAKKINGGGALQDDAGNAIAVDGIGNVYTTGYFRSSLDFDPGAGATFLNSAGDRDVFISKFDASGSLVWAKRIGGIGTDAGNGIAVDGEGNVYTVGWFSGLVDFDPGAATFHLSSLGQDDAFILKLDTAGNFVWAQKFGGTGATDATDIFDVAVDLTGSVFVTGRFTETVDLDPGSGVSLRISEGQYDGFVLKLNSSGQFSWAQTVGGAGWDELLSIAIDGSGGVYVAGWFSGSLNYPGFINLGFADVLVAKFSAVGDWQWGTSAGGADFDQAYGIDVAADGSIYLAGEFRVSATFGSSTLTGGNDGTGFISKLDPTGEFVWTRQIGFRWNQYNSVSSVKVGISGDIIVMGHFQGVIDVDPGPGVVLLDEATDQTSIFISSLDENGQFRWARTFTGPAKKRANDLAVDRDGNVYTTGYFKGTVDFDPGIGTFNMTDGGGNDIFISKLSENLLFSDPGGSGDLVLRRNGRNLDLFRRTLGFGETLVDRQTLSGVRSVQITGSNTAANGLIVDFGSGGSFTIPDGIYFDGGSDNNDRITVLGAGNEGITFIPNSGGFGKFTAYGQSVNFSRVDAAVVSNTQHLIIETLGGADVLTATSSFGYQNNVATKIAVTTGGAAMVPVTFENVQQLTIDTGLNDTTLATSNDNITFAAGSLDARGLRNIFVRTGKGNDTLKVTGPDIGLPNPGGSFWFLGGSGVDRITGIGDAHWQINDLRLVSSGGGRVLLDEIEKATLTGGASVNNLSAVGFTGDATLDGGAGNDLIRGGSGNDLITGGTGNDRIFGGEGDDQIYGQDGNDILNGESGEDIVYGGAGSDRLFGGDDNDWLYGDAGNDFLFGGTGDDLLNGGTDNDWLAGDVGNDTLIGAAGIDLYDLQGTANADDLRLQRISATSALFRRKPRGLVSVIEQDAITMDAADEFLISALSGDDLIAIDTTFSQLGSVDGSDGIDSCTSPAAWTKVSC